MSPLRYLASNRAWTCGSRPIEIRSVKYGCMNSVFFLFCQAPRYFFNPFSVKVTDGLSELDVSVWILKSEDVICLVFIIDNTNQSTIYPRISSIRSRANEFRPGRKACMKPPAGSRPTPSNAAAQSLASME